MLLNLTSLMAALYIIQLRYHSAPTTSCYGQELKRIVAVAKRCDAWLLVDEVYRGAEHTGEVHFQLSYRCETLCPLTCLTCNLQCHSIRRHAPCLRRRKLPARPSCSELAPLVGTVKVHVQAQCTLSWCSHASVCLLPGAAVAVGPARRLRQGGVHRRPQQVVWAVGAAVRLAGCAPQAAAGLCSP